MTDNLLNEISRKGGDRSLIFINAREFPDSYKLSGLYSQKNDTITLKMKIRSGETAESFIITGADQEELKKYISDKIGSVLNR